MLQRFGENLPAREVKFAPVDLKSVEADGTFAGYASLFGEVDLGQDLVMPGALRHRLTLEEVNRVSDGGGGFTESWVELVELWANLRPVSGGERVEADRLTGHVSHEISLRYRADVVPAMRLRDGSRVFHILAAIDVGERHRWLKCLCEEREL